jgi:hypothetical protein
MSKASLCGATEAYGGGYGAAALWLVGGGRRCELLLGLRRMAPEFLAAPSPACTIDSIGLDLWCCLGVVCSAATINRSL